MVAGDGWSVWEQFEVCLPSERALQVQMRGQFEWAQIDVVWSALGDLSSVDLESLRPEPAAVTADHSDCGHVATHANTAQQQGDERERIHREYSVSVGVRGCLKNRPPSWRPISSSHRVMVRA